MRFDSARKKVINLKHFDCYFRFLPLCLHCPPNLFEVEKDMEEVVTNKLEVKLVGK